MEILKNRFRSVGFDAAIFTKIGCREAWSKELSSFRRELAFLLKSRAEVLDSAMVRTVILLVYLMMMGFSAAAQVDSLRIQEGTASFYGKKFHGKKTASGEVFSLDSMTAAHKRLPLGTWVRVINLKNNLSVVVRINDRLPAYSKRQIDISRSAAERIEMVRDGLTKVRIEAADLDQLEKLVEYYAEKDHPGLRIRPYYQGIAIPERQLDKRLASIKKL